MLARSLQAATIKATQAIHKRNLGDVIPTPPKPLNGSLSSSPILSDAVEKWATYKVKGGWSAKTENDFKHWMKGFIELLGDRPIDTYGKADIRVFKETLMELPANRQKIKETRNLSIHDALATAVRAEVSEFVRGHAHLLDDEGRQRLVRHGFLPEREVMTIARQAIA